MQKPVGYDEIQAVNKGEYKGLEPGGYICRIVGAREEISKNGNKMIVLAIDIAEGEHKDFYKRKLERDKVKRQDAKHQGLFWQLIEGDNMPYFKGVITAIEESNDGYKYNFDESTLKNKLVGVAFGRDWFYNSKLELKSNVKPFYIRSVDAVKTGIEVPQDRYPKGVKPQPQKDFSTISEPADDEDLPF